MINPGWGSAAQLNQRVTVGVTIVTAIRNLFLLAIMLPAHMLLQMILFLPVTMRLRPIAFTTCIATTTKHLVLVIEFLDRLTLKINELAQIYPGLMKFQSLELSPYSWMAVAWYPIYQIPVTRNVKELSACFITYHKLSSFQAYDANLLATVSDAHNMGGLPGLLSPCMMQGVPLRVYQHKIAC